MHRNWIAGIAAAGVGSGAAVALAGIAGGGEPSASTQVVVERAQPAASVAPQPTAAKRHERDSSPGLPQPLEIWARTADGRCVQIGFASWAIYTPTCVPGAAPAESRRRTR